MNDERLAEIEALAEAATPGPWLQSAHDDNDYPTYDLVCDFLQQEDMYLVAEDMRVEDAAFIAAARQAVPELVSEVRRLRASHARLTAGDPYNDAGYCKWCYGDYYHKPDCAYTEAIALQPEAD